MQVDGLFSTLIFEFHQIVCACAELESKPNPSAEGFTEFFPCRDGVIPEGGCTPIENVLDIFFLISCSERNHFSFVTPSGEKLDWHIFHQFVESAAKCISRRHLLSSYQLVQDHPNFFGSFNTLRGIFGLAPPHRNSLNILSNLLTVSSGIRWQNFHFMYTKGCYKGIKNCNFA